MAKRKAAYFAAVADGSDSRSRLGAPSHQRLLALAGTRASA